MPRLSLKLKEEYGFENNAGLIRLLFTQKYEVLEKESVLEKQDSTA